MILRLKNINFTIIKKYIHSHAMHACIARNNIKWDGGRLYRENKIVSHFKNRL